MHIERNEKIFMIKNHIYLMRTFLQLIISELHMIILWDILKESLPSSLPSIIMHKLININTDSTSRQYSCVFSPRKDIISSMETPTFFTNKIPKA